MRVMKVQDQCKTVQTYFGIVNHSNILQINNAQYVYRVKLTL